MAIQLLLFIVWFGWKGGVDWPNFQNGGREAEGPVNAPPGYMENRWDPFWLQPGPCPWPPLLSAPEDRERAGSQGPTSVAAFLASSSAF